MRRFSLIALSMSLLLGLAVSTASARGHRRVSHKSAHSHHARVRHEHFGAADSSGSTTTSSAPSTTTTPSQSAGTVASFTGGRLTLTLNDGSTVSGMVTDATKIDCTSSNTSGDDDSSNETMHRNRDEGSGDGGSDTSANSGSQDNSTGSSTSGESRSGDDSSDSGSNDDGDAGNAPACGTADLTPGAVVSSAGLALSSAGSNWTDVELAR